MQRSKQTLIQVAKTYSPAVLPVLAAVAAALPAAYHAVEPAGVQSTTTGWAAYISWSRYVPTSLGNGFLIALMTGGTALVAYWIAWRRRIASNVATITGIIAVAVLTWTTQWCNTTGATIVGAAIAGMIVAGAAVYRVESDRGLLKTLEGWWSNSASPGN